MSAGIERFTVFYYGDRPDDVAMVGQFELIEAQRKYGKSLHQAMVDGSSMEHSSFAVFRALIRQGTIASTDFEVWLTSVARVAAEEGESPAPPE